MNKLKRILYTLWENNILILVASAMVLGASLFSKNGIIFTFIEYRREKANNHQMLTELQYNVDTTREKIRLTKIRNIEMVEEINYKYKNQCPYSQYRTIEVIDDKA